MSVFAPSNIRCPICGYLNLLTYVYCCACGTRLVSQVRMVSYPPSLPPPAVEAPVAYIPPVYPIYAWPPGVVYMY